MRRLERADRVGVIHGNAVASIQRVMREKRTIKRSVAVVLAIFIHASTLSAELVDRIVAAVNNDVITLSELRQAVAFNAALGARQDGERLEAETLNGLINRRLLVREALRLRIVEVSDQDIAAEVANLRTRLGSEQAFADFLARLEMTEEQLVPLLGARLLVEKFVEKKISLFARVSREEAQGYYSEHRDTFKGKRFPEVQKQIVSILSEQKIAQQLDLYIAELRSKTDIRVNP